MEFDINAISTEDAFRALPSVHLRAMQNHTSISAQMEIESPSGSRINAEDDVLGYDAYQRVCEWAGVATVSLPQAGIYASPVWGLLTGEHKMPNGEKIGKAHGRALAMIWAERIWRTAKYGQQVNTRSMFTIDEDTVGSALRPFAEAASFRDIQNNQPNLPLSAIVANELSIEGDAFKSVYIDETQIGDFDLLRVEEGSDIPTVYLKTHEQQVRLFKKGRAINWTHEAARNMRLDKFEIILLKMAYDVEYGKVKDAIQTIITGDGNANTAASVVKMTEMDGSLAPNDDLSLRAYLRFKKVFRGAYQLNTFIGNIEDIVDFEMIEVGLNATPLVGLDGQNGSSIGAITNLREDTTPNVVAYADVDPGVIATGKYLGFDRRYSLERISQIGAAVSEADTFIGNQTNLLTFTDVDGFDILFSKAARVLDTAQ